MKIGDKIVIDKEYYIQKHIELYSCNVSEVFPKELMGYRKHILDGDELLIVNISAINYSTETVIYVEFIDDDGCNFMIPHSFIKDDTLNQTKDIPKITNISNSVEIELGKNTNVENITKLLKEKKSTRKSIEDRIINNIRSNTDLYKPDLSAIFALSVTITALEELLVIEKQK